MKSSSPVEKRPRQRLQIAAGFVIAAVLILGAMARGIVSAAETERAEIAPASVNKKVSLRDRLIVGLEARLKSEVAFVDLVVLKVNTGKLPQRLVDETFFWARDRASAHRNGVARRPIIFFQPAMAARAKRLKVDLPYTTP
jgi:hypothetical protein